MSIIFSTGHVISEVISEYDFFESFSRLQERLKTKSVEEELAIAHL